MLAAGSEEVMDSIIAQRIEIVIGGVWIHCRLQGVHTGTGDGGGRKPLVGIGVVGGVRLGVYFGAAGGIQDGGINVQIARRLTGGVIEPVVDDRGDLALVGTVGLLRRSPSRSWRR